MNSGIIFLVVIGIVALMALVAFVIHRVLRLKIKNDDKEVDEKKIVEEELNRVLVPVDDEETARQISEYKEDEE